MTSIYEKREIGSDTLLLLSNVISASLSILGCLFIITLFLAYKELRSFASRLIFWLSVVDLLCALILIVTPNPGTMNSSTYCTIQALFSTFLSLSSIFLTNLIALCVYVSLHYPSINPRRYEKAFMIYVFLPSLTLAVLPLITNSYGPTSGWCWINESESESLRITYTILIFYGPLWITTFINLLLYCKSFRLLKNVCGENIGREMKIVQKLR